MSLKGTILLSFSFVFFIIGLHQTFLHGITFSYFLFMFSLVFLMLFAVRRKKEEQDSEPKQNPSQSVKKDSKRKKK